VDFTFTINYMNFNIVYPAVYVVNLCKLHECKSTSRDLGLAGLLLTSIYLYIIPQKRHVLTFTLIYIYI
jgi:hypothetical protein